MKKLFIALTALSSISILGIAEHNLGPANWGPELREIPKACVSAQKALVQANQQYESAKVDFFRKQFPTQAKAVDDANRQVQSACGYGIIQEPLTPIMEPLTPLTTVTRGGVINN